MMSTDEMTIPATTSSAVVRRVLFALGVAAVVALMLWQALTAGGNPDPSVHASSTVAMVDIGVLVFREGLECILVLAAITASMVGKHQGYRRPVTIGAALAFVASLITWFIAVGIVDQLADNFSALQIQAVTGLIAIIVLLVVMNWFFHKVYWSGWISLHTKKKKELIETAAASPMDSRQRLFFGLALLGFSSLYREGFEIVLFLQKYRLELGTTPVLRGTLVGLAFTAIVAVLTFVANQRLPYKKMLIITGAMLGVVLLVMVGEQAQEMQLAGWIPTTPVPRLERVIPGWAGLWFAVFPTVETLVAQVIAAVAVLGSYTFVRLRLMWRGS